MFSAPTSTALACCYETIMSMRSSSESSVREARRCILPPDDWNSNGDILFRSLRHNLYDLVEDFDSWWPEVQSIHSTMQAVVWYHVHHLEWPCSCIMWVSTRAGRAMAEEAIRFDRILTGVGTTRSLSKSEQDTQNFEVATTNCHEQADFFNLGPGHEVSWTLFQEFHYIWFENLECLPFYYNMGKFSIDRLNNTVGRGNPRIPVVPGDSNGLVCQYGSTSFESTFDRFS